VAKRGAAMQKNAKTRAKKNGSAAAPGRRSTVPQPYQRWLGWICFTFSRVAIT
jgi:hypothetical protein